MFAAENICLRQAVFYLRGKNLHRINPSVLNFLSQVPQNNDVTSTSLLISCFRKKFTSPEVQQYSCGCTLNNDTVWRISYKTQTPPSAIISQNLRWKPWILPKLLQQHSNAGPSHLPLYYHLFTASTSRILHRADKQNKI